MQDKYFKIGLDKDLMPEERSLCLQGVMFLKYYILKSEMLKMTIWLEDKGCILEM